MFKLLIPAAASIALVAFAARTQPVDASAASAAFQPAQAAMMGWHLSYEGSMAKLAYGAADSDQVALMATCSPGDRAAVIYGDAQPVSPRLVQASDVIAPVDPMSQGEAYETRLALADEAFTRLASRGQMKVQDQDGAYQLTASLQERRMIAGFLSYCGSSRA
ncbi:hypothetical protein LTR94_029225 [Friedmanniomyces endolithicus]|nr:hypothetical protein LTR94_029225 [Friedmanniomyces endolithicus]